MKQPYVAPNPPKRLTLHSKPVARSGFKSTMLLLTALSGTALVAGCSLTDIRNPFGSQRKEQVVDGERRSPIYNTVDMQKIEKARQAEPAGAVMPTAPIPPAMTTPMVQAKGDTYDYYAAASEQTKADSARALGSLNPAPIRVDSAKSVRKPLSENLYSANNVSHSTTRNLASQYTENAPAQPPVLKTTPAVASSVAAPSVAAVSETPPVVDAEASEPSFFSRIFGNVETKQEKGGSLPPWKSRGEPVEELTVSESEKNAEAASLSSVPQVPSEFNAIRESREQNIQRLQAEHSHAQTQKQALTGEPTQQPMTAVEMPSPPPQAPKAVESQTFNSPLPSAAQPASSYPLSTPAMPAAMSAPAENMSQGVRSPRRGIDIMTQDEWEALQKAKALQQSVPQQSVPQSEIQQTIPAEVVPPVIQPLSNDAPVEKNPNGTNNLIMTKPPGQRSTPVPTESSPSSSNWWEGGGSSSDGADKQAPAQPVAPQSSLAPALEPVAEKKEEPQVGMSAGNADANTPAMEVAEHRPSFFARFFGEPSPAAETSPVLAEQKAPDTAIQEDASVKAVAVEKAPPTVDASSHEAASKEPEKKAVDAEPSFASDWLQSLVSGAQARPVNEGPAPAKAEVVNEKTAATETAEAPLKPAAETQGDSAALNNDGSQLIGHMTDKSAMSLVTPPQINLRPAPQAENKPQAETKPQAENKPQVEQVPSAASPAKAELVAEKTPETAVVQPAEAQEKPPVRHSFLSRLLGIRPTGEASEDAPVLDASEDKKLADLLPPPSDEEAPQVASETAQAPQKEELMQDEKSMASAPSAAPSPAQDVQTDERPSFFSRMLNKQPQANQDSAIADSRAVSSEPMPEPTVKAVFEKAAQASAPEKPLPEKTVAVEPANVAPVAEKPAEAPVEKAVSQEAAPAQVVEPEQPRPSFFSRLFKKSEPEADAKPSAGDAVSSQPELSAATETVIDASQEKAAPPPALISASAPVMTVVTGDATIAKSDATAAAAAAAKTPSALPSPRLLDQVKTMPVSRYSARAKAAKQQPDDH